MSLLGTLRERSLFWVVALSIVAGAASCSSGGATAGSGDQVSTRETAVDETAVAATEGVPIADDAEPAETDGEAEDSQPGDAAGGEEDQAENASGLPKTAVGTAVVTDDGGVSVVDGGPPHWTQVYSAADHNGSGAVDASVSGKRLAYVLDDGAVFTRTRDAATSEPSQVWSADGGKSPALSVDIQGDTVVIVAADGTVHSLNVGTGSVTDSTIWEAQSGKAEQISAVESGVFVRHEGKVAFVAKEADQAPRELVSGGAIAIDARKTRLVSLDASGTVTRLDVAQADAAPTVLWDGTGAASKVVDIALGSSLVMLFEDGTVLRKSLGNDEPAAGTRTVWNQIEKSGPAATKIGSHNKLVMVQLDNGRSRWFDLSAPKGKRSGFYFPRDAGQTVASFAS